MGNTVDYENYNSSFLIDNFMIFDEVQHTANYTPGETTELPVIFQEKYIPCLGGTVDNEESQFYGNPIPDKSNDPDFIYAWKILD